MVAHNSACYNTHLFIKELAESFKNIRVIAKKKEDLISFSVNISADRYIDKNGEEKKIFMELRFIGSFKFMATSLDSLTKILVGIHNLGEYHDLYL